MTVIKFNLILKCSVLILKFSNVVHINNKKLKKKNYMFKYFGLNFSFSFLNPTFYPKNTTWPPFFFLKFKV